MAEFHARIGRVRMKNGGADVHVIHGGITDAGEAICGTIRRHARQNADMDEPNSRLDGFVLIGLFDDGKSTIGFRLPKRLPPSLAMAYITERLRQDIVIADEAASVFDDKFEWVEG